MTATFQSELQRKTVHLVMGMFCMSLPWIFSEAWQVDLLAAVSLVILLGIRWFAPRLGSVLHGVQRLSFGELLFPVGVALVFRLSAGELSVYLPAIGVLTFADAAGALVGKRYGTHHYRTNAGQKSLEGSLAVFLVSFIITFACLARGDLLNAALIATVVGLVATMAEGVLGAGLDNVVLPFAVYGLLLFLQELSSGDLLARIGIITTLGLALFGVRRVTSLNGGGLLSATIFGYLCYALGGPSYLIAPILIFLIHLITTSTCPELRDMEHSADAVAAVALPGLIWVTFKTSSELPSATCYLGFCLSIVAHSALLHAATQHHLGRKPDTKLCLVKAVTVGLSCPHPLIAFPPLAARWLGKLTRVDQAMLSFLFSLTAILVE